MRLRNPRVAPLTDEEMRTEDRELFSGFAGREGILNIFRTLARAPKALMRFQGWGAYVMSRRNEVPAREREILILRTGWLCRSGYEWTQHEEIGKACGLTPDEIARIKEGPEAEGWTAHEAALLRAADELVGDHFVSDASWAALSPYTDKQKMDVVFTIAQYTQVSMMLNSFGVQLDEGQHLDPDLDHRR